MDTGITPTLAVRIFHLNRRMLGTTLRQLTAKKLSAGSLGLKISGLP